MSRLGERQRKLLQGMTVSSMVVVADRETRALCKRGLMREFGDGSFVGVTAAGLRAVADEMDAGRIVVTSPVRGDQP